MSLTALAVVLCHIAVYGTAREADEGATAHIWQILMAGQMPILAFFAIKWFPRAPKQSLCVLAAQAGAALASMAPVFLLNL
jgi:triacylglycerol esterase/lipase EstA (alpha/beta hydrolase family)